PKGAGAPAAAGAPAGEGQVAPAAFARAPGDGEDWAGTVPLAPAPGGRFPPLRPLGQIAGTYLVAEGPDGLYLIDQHAAHERVTFETLQRSSGPLARQPLAVPVALEVSAAQASFWEERADVLAACGFEVEDFGGGTLLVRAVPVVFGGEVPAETLRDLLDRLEEALRDGRSVVPPLERARMALAACRASVRARDRLDAAGMASLLDALAACREPFTCPHGRPTVLFVGLYALERAFHRRA
ncbi:MAG: DNA mismatch repair protein MutL, partial [Clostridia bacterium]|nr:DNA mismatch repair protein MutL [Clostridia bacterium]